MTDGDGDNASVNKTRPRSRSRIRRVKNGDEKPMGSRLKKIMRGISRKSSRSVGDAASVASTSQAVSLQPEWQKTSETSSPSKTAPVTEIETLSLELVLLLLDPTTRRFELLQLEFDSLRARVVDILAQIPVSVTEDSIRNQQYEGVIVETCELMDQTARLVDFCRGKQVLVALPKGLSIKDCVRLARPILSNAKVLEMVRFECIVSLKDMLLHPSHLFLTYPLLSLHMVGSMFPNGSGKRDLHPHCQL